MDKKATQFSNKYKHNNFVLKFNNIFKNPLGKISKQKCLIQNIKITPTIKKVTINNKPINQANTQQKILEEFRQWIPKHLKTVEEIIDIMKNDDEYKPATLNDKVRKLFGSKIEVTVLNDNRLTCTFQNKDNINNNFSKLERFYDNKLGELLLIAKNNNIKFEDIISSVMKKSDILTAITIIDNSKNKETNKLQQQYSIKQTNINKKLILKKVSAIKPTEQKSNAKKIKFITKNNKLLSTILPTIVNTIKKSKISFAKPKIIFKPQKDNIINNKNINNKLQILLNKNKLKLIKKINIVNSINNKFQTKNNDKILIDNKILQ